MQVAKTGTQLADDYLLLARNGEVILLMVRAFASVMESYNFV